ncbi:MAG: phenylalanine--tRNA ligase subunit alpha, partial [bacterium]
ERDHLTLTEKGKMALSGTVEPDEVIVAYLAEEETASVPELKSKLVGVDVEKGVAMLQARGELVRIKKRVVRTFRLTEKGVLEAKEQAGLATGFTPDSIPEEVTQLEPEMLATGSWRNLRFRRYDVTLPVKPRYPGKEHPLQRIVAEARRAFLEMGFEETSSPIVEIAFWDFDALFQPQDHPAREMQDTFYLSESESHKLPDDSIVRRVAQTHEDGADTGSKGWRYHWDKKEAARLLLRTHTTAATIRALAQNPKPPRKVFCIGKVFRRENMDATHLPEFIQIDGIIVDENASLVTLFGTLAQFYRKMGAKEVRFRPSYFPYTEPSVEVFAHLGRLGWVEMGGAGVFRQEVTRPLGCPVRVLAWGLGLERLAMMRFGVNDIRKLYWADINWLREAKLCR